MVNWFFIFHINFLMFCCIKITNTEKWFHLLCTQLFMRSEMLGSVQRANRVLQSYSSQSKFSPTSSTPNHKVRLNLIIISQTHQVIQTQKSPLLYFSFHFLSRVWTFSVTHMACFQSLLLNNYSLKLVCEREKTQREGERKTAMGLLTQ